jgi:hypothetical protein
LGLDRKKPLLLPLFDAKVADGEDFKDFAIRKGFLSMLAEMRYLAYQISWPHMIANRGLGKPVTALIVESRLEFWEIVHYLLETESRRMGKVLGFARTFVALECTVA